MLNWWQEELAAIQAVREARGDEANGGISVLWWAIACIAGAMFWALILLAFG